MQGTVPGPIKACVQIDTLARDCYKYREELFLYKTVFVSPPLSMCVDVASVSRSGIESIKNTINFKLFH